MVSLKEMKSQKRLLTTEKKRALISDKFITKMLTETVVRHLKFPASRGRCEPGKSRRRMNIPPESRPETELFEADRRRRFSPVTGNAFDGMS